MRIGIIGVGYVGKAVLESYQGREVVCRDPVAGYAGTIDEILNTDAVFVCVPSPTTNDGKCDTSILEAVLEELKDYRGVIISKVTAPPDRYRELEQRYPRLIHAPEFLTAANSVNDYKNSKFLIVGGKPELLDTAVDAILLGLNKNIIVKKTDIATASLCKCTINSFLATKVAFMNEIYSLAERAGINYNQLIDLVTVDTRIGTSHTQVPGPDGQRGFAGACFPKDTTALAHYADTVGEDLSILKQAIKSNKKIRESNK